MAKLLFPSMNVDVQNIKAFELNSRLHKCAVLWETTWLLKGIYGYSMS